MYYSPTELKQLYYRPRAKIVQEPRGPIEKANRIGLVYLMLLNLYASYSK